MRKPPIDPKKVITLYNEGVSIAEIARLNDRSTSVMYKYIHKLQQRGLIRKSLKYRRNVSWLSTGDKRYIVKLYKRGCTTAEIADKVGRSYSDTRRILLKLDEYGVIDYVPFQPRWSEEELTELKYYMRRNCTIEEISQLMSIDVCRVYNKIDAIKRGKNEKDRSFYNT